MKSKKAKISLVVILVLAVIVLFASLYTVRQNSYVVIRQFGKIVQVNENPGLALKIPFIQESQTITKAIQLSDIAPSDVITKDKKTMIADNYILWKVVDPIRYVQTLNASATSAEDRISVAVYNATKNTISAMTQDEVIAARGSKMTELITAEANSDIGDYGISIIQCEIKSLDLPDDNKEAVYERMISERNNIAASYTAEGQAEAQKIRNATDKEVTVMEAEAKRNATEIEAEGEATYMDTLQAAYNSIAKADFYNFLRSLDALRASLAGSNDKTVILDKDSELAQILYGQIDTSVPQEAAPAAPATPAAAAAGN